MGSRGEIKSEKILIKEVFRKWFRIPEYQRPYVWGYEEITDLLDDLTFAQREKPAAEYFLGSFVFQAKPAAPEHGRVFPENDLLDGQQRMTTLLLLLAVLRDLTENSNIKREDIDDVVETCQGFIYQKGSAIKQLPERSRLVYSIREEAQEFIEKHIKPTGGTDDKHKLKEAVAQAKDLTAQNMAQAVLVIRRYFEEQDEVKPEVFLPFLINRVLMIYVATEDLEDAFRLFMILNNRGTPLRNSDIIKSVNLGALDSNVDKARYAKLWEDAEGELGDDFDRFLNHIRTILVKEKARSSLLQEFEDKIYQPKEQEKETGQQKPVLLHKGKETFVLIEKYLAHYHKLLGGHNIDKIGNFQLDNLIKVMLAGMPATDWVPPLLLYFERFGYTKLLTFLTALDNKFSADWIGQYTPTDRIDAMNNLLRRIDQAKTAEDVLGADSFAIDADSMIRVLDGPVYGKRFARYILLKLDYYFQNHDQRMHFEKLSVEHILPQNPTEESRWVADFTAAQRGDWTHRLGNLILITCRKNSSLGRLDFSDKVGKYFTSNIDTCPHSLRVLNAFKKWTPEELEKNHVDIMDKIRASYGIEKGTDVG